MLFNLIQNAIRHTPPDGSVTVRAEPAGEFVEIEVADTGEGIAPADRDRVFEPFVQGAGREPRSDGAAGLGLAISRAIVEAHGGRIWLGECTEGTSVRFSLPTGLIRYGSRHRRTLRSRRCPASPRTRPPCASRNASSRAVSACGSGAVSSIQVSITAPPPRVACTDSTRSC